MSDYLMKSETQIFTSTRLPTAKRSLCAIAAAVAVLVSPHAANAFEIPLDDPNMSLNWDTTVKHSAAVRTLNKSDALTAGSVSVANQDDGDRNFKRGLVSNRVDIFTEADFKAGNFGARVSAAAWYDTVYNRSNSNDSPGTSNNKSVSSKEFTNETRDVMGRKAELLDAFVFGKADLGDVPVNLRVGKHALQWGESLFFGSNAIAGSMVPLDIVKAAQIPNSLTREIIRPVGQVSGTAALSSNVSVAGYYQYDWDKSRLPAAGSFFSGGDILDAGGECLRVAVDGNCGDRGKGLTRLDDVKAKESGQFGAKLKYSDKENGVDYAVHALRYHSKTPINGLITAVVPGGPKTPVPVSYRLYYPENIDLLGVSFATQVSGYQWSGEFSTRRNAPLVGSPAPALITANNNNTSPGYAVGNTAHANISLLTSLPVGLLGASSTSLLGEVAWNRVLSVTKNPGALSKTAERDALAFRVVYAPTYIQVADGLDITVPVGIGYSPKGKSSAVSNFAVDKGGDISIGVTGTYLAVWQFGLTYRHFFGPVGPTQDDKNQFTFKQSLKDRNTISLSLSRTF